MAYIEWNDGVLRTLGNTNPAPGNRFIGWRPQPVAVGPRNVGLGSGDPVVFLFRNDAWVEFAIHELRPSQLDLAQRALYHILGGGNITAYTADAAARTYVMNIGESGEGSIDGPDEFGEYTLRLRLRCQVAGTIPLCVY